MTQHNMMQASEFQTNGRNEAAHTGMCCKMLHDRNMSPCVNMSCAFNPAGIKPTTFFPLMLFTYRETHSALNPAACVFFLFCCLSFPSRITVESAATVLDIKSLCCDTSIAPLLLLDLVMMKDQDAFLQHCHMLQVSSRL